MNNRTMVKLTDTGNCISLRTVSRKRRSVRYLLLKSELMQLKERGHILSNDLHSFAELQYDPGSDIVTIHFSWLTCTGAGSLSGYVEAIRLSYSQLMDFILTSDEGKEMCLLSMKEHSRPKLDFSNAGKLAEVAADKRLRHKLSRFLRDNFNWKGTDEIRFSNDFIPYSFFFREYRGGKPCICGGVILHGQENMKTAYYAIHT